ncbi:MAG: HEAT repeat domain-containing protein [Oligoflexales bacterium]
MEVIKGLISKLNTQSDKRALALINQICTYGQDAVGLLIRAAKDPTAPRFQKWALRALGQSNHASATKTLIRALRDPKMTIRQQALRALRDQGRQENGKYLVPLLQDPSGGIRENAADAIAELKYKPARTQLIKCLEDEKWYVRQRAAVALGILGGKNSVPALRALAASEIRKVVIKAATDALAAIAGNCVPKERGTSNKLR